MNGAVNGLTTMLNILACAGDVQNVGAVNVQIPYFIHITYIIVHPVDSPYLIMLIQSKFLGRSWFNHYYFKNTSLSLHVNFVINE